MDRRSRWSPLGLALLCAHCTMSGLLAGLALVGGSAAVIGGVNIHYIWPPFFILGGFAWYIWSGRRAAACALPEG